MPKQSHWFCRCFQDCFASLAMTRREDRPAFEQPLRGAHAKVQQCSMMVVPLGVLLSRLRALAQESMSVVSSQLATHGAGLPVLLPPQHRRCWRVQAGRCSSRLARLRPTWLKGNCRRAPSLSRDAIVYYITCARQKGMRTCLEIRLRGGSVGFLRDALARVPHVDIQPVKCSCKFAEMLRRSCTSRAFFVGSWREPTNPAKSRRRRDEVGTELD